MGEADITLIQRLDLENVRLRKRVAELERHQAWIDAVGGPDHLDDERPFCRAYLNARDDNVLLERQAEHLRRENDRLRAAAGNCGGEPMVERRAQAHAGEEADR